MRRWVVEDGGTELAVVEATPNGHTVTVQMTTTDPVAITPDLADNFRNALGLAAGVARGDIGASDG